MKPTLRHPRSLTRLLVASLFAAPTLPASAAPFADAEMAAGAQMPAENCIACHVQRFAVLLFFD